jgi:hypothetical protein
MLPCMASEQAAGQGGRHDQEIATQHPKGYPACLLWLPHPECCLHAVDTVLIMAGAVFLHVFV